MIDIRLTILMLTTILLRRLTLKKMYLLAAMSMPTMTSKTLKHTPLSTSKRRLRKHWTKNKEPKRLHGLQKRDLCKLKARSRGQKPRRSLNQPNTD